jgi:hypothetical protein
VFTPYIIDAMTIQMLFNPNILEFWQVIMGMRRGSAVAHEAQVEEKKQPEDGRGSLRLAWTKSQRRHPSKASSLPKQGVFDKLDIPLGFEGKTFRELFSYLLNRHGTIAIGLYRSCPAFFATLSLLLSPHNSALLIRNPSTNRPSSYVAILPPESAIVSITDQVFVLMPGK